MLFSKKDEIVRQFINKIYNDKISKKIQVMIRPFGLIGSGKSTVIIPLSKMLSLPRVSGDEIRFALQDAGLSEDCLPEVFTEIVDHFLKNGFGLAVDTDSTFSLDKIKLITKRFKLKPIFIHINPPEEFILKKLWDYNGRWLVRTKEEFIEQYYDRKRRSFEIIKRLKFDYEIDTSLPDLDDKIKHIAQEIKSSKYLEIHGDSVQKNTYTT